MTESKDTEMAPSAPSRRSSWILLLLVLFVALWFVLLGIALFLVTAYASTSSSAYETYADQTLHNLDDRLHALIARADTLATAFTSAGTSLQSGMPVSLPGALWSTLTYNHTTTHFCAWLPDEQARTIFEPFGGAIVSNELVSTAPYCPIWQTSNTSLRLHDAYELYPELLLRVATVKDQQVLSLTEDRLTVFTPVNTIEQWLDGVLIQEVSISKLGLIPAMDELFVTLGVSCWGHEQLLNQSLWTGRDFVRVYDNEERPNDMMRTVHVFRDDTNVEVMGPGCHIRMATYPLEEEYNSLPLWCVLLTTLAMVTSLVTILVFTRVCSSSDSNRAGRTTDPAALEEPIKKHTRFAPLSPKTNQRPLDPIPKGSSSKRLRDYIAEGILMETNSAAPVADLFPHTVCKCVNYSRLFLRLSNSNYIQTVMCFDICNFSAWCSEREPSQIFTLLEAIIQAFDEMALSLGVVMVETLADSYMAVCGLPQPREHHAVIMAVFASNCLAKMDSITSRLEKQLGPNTGDLQARVGMHSGPVTAGILRRDEKHGATRFQLLGETVTIAERMEATSRPHKIQCSEATAELLRRYDKGDWIKQRKKKTPVKVKGKGMLGATYWLNPDVLNRLPYSSPADSFIDASETNFCSDEESDSFTTGNDKMSRLVEWNVEVMLALLEKLVVSREINNKSRNPIITTPYSAILAEEERILKKSKKTVPLDEVTEILSMPRIIDAKSIPPDSGHSSIKSNRSVLSPKVREELRAFITEISKLYRQDVPFHNFEHASHVIMSAGKLMNRILHPDEVEDLAHSSAHKKPKRKLNKSFSAVDLNTAKARHLHHATYGISSDPLMEFAAVFSALIHDVDHKGLTNAELNDEGTSTTKHYRQKSVAEQNSIDVAWGILMEDRYKQVRSCIYSTVEELHRFRQLIVNAVVATDIADKDLKSKRERRWEDAFKGEKGDVSFKQTDIDRKATIVFEYIIQASDICHTMQHWQTYQKYNLRLFEERYLAWLRGHCDKEPSQGWYGGELWFFDNYIIPLAQKLDKCGVFGVSYDEYLNYAMENRREWEEKGKQAVSCMLEACQEKHGKKRSAKRRPNAM